eukprot:COSAG05_NODE_23656_length_256_cov_0.974522_1_plen_72_part_00
MRNRQQAQEMLAEAFDAGLLHHVTFAYGIEDEPHLYTFSPAMESPPGRGDGWWPIDCHQLQVSEGADHDVE